MTAYRSKPSELHPFRQYAALTKRTLRCLSLWSSDRISSHTAGSAKTASSACRSSASSAQNFLPSVIFGDYVFDKPTLKR